MVRPNQIIDSTSSTLTFLLPAQNKKQAKRRAVLLNFPGVAIPVVLKRDSFNQYVESVEVVTKGLINRYKVTVNTESINNG